MQQHGFIAHILESDLYSLWISHFSGLHIQSMGSLKSTMSNSSDPLYSNKLIGNETQTQTIPCHLSHITSIAKQQ